MFDVDIRLLMPNIIAPSQSVEINILSVIAPPFCQYLPVLSVRSSRTQWLGHVTDIGENQRKNKNKYCHFTESDYSFLDRLFADALRWRSKHAIGRFLLSQTAICLLLVRLYSVQYFRGISYMSFLYRTSLNLGSTCIFVEEYRLMLGRCFTYDSIVLQSGIVRKILLKWSQLGGGDGTVSIYVFYLIQCLSFTRLRHHFSCNVCICTRWTVKYRDIIHEMVTGCS